MNLYIRTHYKQTGLMVLILVIRAQFLCQRTWTVKNTRLMEGDTCGLLFERVVKQHNYDVRTFSRILERFSKHYIIDISHTRQPSKARASDNFQGYLHIEFPLFARKLIFADLVTLAEIALRPRVFNSSWKIWAPVFFATELILA